MSDTDREGPVIRSLSDTGETGDCGSSSTCLADRLGLLLAITRPPERAAVSGEDDR